MKKQSYWTAELLLTPVLLAGTLMLSSKANYMLILAGKIVDHTTMEYLHNFRMAPSKRGIPVPWSGWSSSGASRITIWPIA